MLSTEMNKKLKLLNNEMRKLQRKAYNVSEPLGIDLISNDFDGCIYIDESALPTENEDNLLFTPIAERIAFQLSEQDFPVSIRDGEKFCEYWEFSEKDTSLILSKCATVEQYQSYIEYERNRSMDY